MKKSLIFCTAIFLIIFFKNQLTVCAYDTDEILYTEEFEHLYESVEALSNDRFSFFDYLHDLLSKEAEMDFKGVIEALIKEAASEIMHWKSISMYIIFIGILSGISANFAQAFENRQPKHLSFYIMYILMITVVLSLYKEAVAVSQKLMSVINEFMQSLVPAYFLSIACSGKISSAMIFYQFILILINLLDKIFENLLIPLINIYVVISLINNMSREDYLSKMSLLIKSIVESCQKAMIAFVIGFNVIQGLITPAIDSFKMTALNKTVSAIPGIGGVTNAVSEMLIGSAVLIKNGVGVTALIFILFISAIPLLKLGIYMMIYKITSALIQPVSDKRIVDSVECVAGGCRLLIKVAGNLVALFMLAIAIITAVT